ncbi:MAG: ATP-dependent protease ATPase subunit HslU [Firmicutes bacterium]|nr:ATP-dependent protease ATPase subunit HslU [Bacillota bacterium]MCL5039252.1 ATP-dependent protease ATPase subunit HslU [Bacillota bacterium]
MDLTPRQIVAELDRYIIGQEKAKRAVAIALRNRARRLKLAPEIREEVTPKNILMIGPTGVGKTEIARRLARLVNAPFVKVEATKFTEVGYVGRDVEGMVRDLVVTAIRMVKTERTEAVKEKAAVLAEERLLDLMAPLPRKGNSTGQNPLQALFGGGAPQTTEEDSEFEARMASAQRLRNFTEKRLARGELEEEMMELEVEDTSAPMLEVISGAGTEEMGVNMQDILGGLLPKRKKRRKVTVREARQILIQEEAAKLIDMDSVASEAIFRAEQSGIIFIDEIDKIAGREVGAGPDVSREGVQRDILPIVEGSTVATKHGQVKTNHILFIAAGAFHTSKPSDLIPELQGRFPIRVELENLTREDFLRILKEPENALTRQYQALLETDGIQLRFADDAIEELADIASQVNEQTENIGARRLHTVMERLLEEISFDAPEREPGEFLVDRSYVRQRLEGISRERDLSRYIL